MKSPQESIQKEEEVELSQKTDGKGFINYKYLILAIIYNIVFLIITQFQEDPRFHAYGFIQLLMGVPLSYFGGLIGVFLRELLLPDMIFGRGFSDLLKAQVFWMIGPQVVGVGFPPFVLLVLTAF